MTTTPPDHFLAYVMGEPVETEDERIAREFAEKRRQADAALEQKRRLNEDYFRQDPYGRAMHAMKTLTNPASTEAERQSASYFHRLASAEIEQRKKVETALQAWEPTPDERN